MAALTVEARAKRRYNKIKLGLNIHPFFNLSFFCYLVLQLVQLETVEIGQRSTNLTLFDLLGPGGLVPGSNGIALFQSLLKSGLTDTTGEFLENNGSQNQTAVRESLTSNASGGTVNESLIIIPNSVKLYPDRYYKRLTRLWSIISTMTANLPASAPWLIRTTRPTST